MELYGTNFTMAYKTIRMYPDPKEKPEKEDAPVKPEKDIPVKPDNDPDPTQHPEKNDPTRIDEPNKNDPTRIDDPVPYK